MCWNNSFFTRTCTSGTVVLFNFIRFSENDAKTNKGYFRQLSPPPLSSRKKRRHQLERHGKQSELIVHVPKRTDVIVSGWVSEWHHGRS